MSKRAKDEAWKAYPKRQEHRCITAFGTLEFDYDAPNREGFIKGYEQAEKDIIALIESRISEILGDAQPAPVLRAELQELIKRIKEEEQ